MVSCDHIGAEPLGPGGNTDAGEEVAEERDSDLPTKSGYEKTSHGGPTSVEAEIDRLSCSS